MNTSVFQLEAVALLSNIFNTLIKFSFIPYENTYLTEFQDEIWKRVPAIFRDPWVVTWKLYGRPRNVVTAGRDRCQHQPDRELGPRVMFTILKVFHYGSPASNSDKKGMCRGEYSEIEQKHKGCLVSQETGLYI